MLTKDFYGKNNFVWWTGIVESRDDPLKLGQVRVRILGLHSEDRSLVRLEDLPWAQVLYSTNGSKTNSTMVEGDWVFGFFQDGEYAQIPVVVGVFPGIRSIQSEIIYRNVVVKKGVNNVPQPAQVDRVLGEPTTHRMARGEVEGSLTEATNQERTHVCDISAQVNWTVNHITGFFGQIVQTIRKGIRAALLALGADPSGQFSKVIQIVKQVNSLASKITKTLQKINEGIQTVIRLAQQIRAMIDYILSLPEKALRFLRECLQRLYAQIAAGIGSILADPDGATGIFFGEASESFRELGQELSKLRSQSGEILKNIITIGTSPILIAEGFLNPSGAEDFNQAEKNFGEFIGKIYQEGSTQNENAIYNQNLYRVP